MKVKYDKETDILYIKLSEDKVAESDESRKGIILDYSEENLLVGIEILNASKSSIQPSKVEYEVAWPWVTTETIETTKITKKH